ncbi:MAG: hypothetical protein QM764_22540 [Chitinophagaceae bacterium]
MLKFSSFNAAYIAAIFLVFVTISCKKDIGGEVAGQYRGIASKYWFGGPEISTGATANVIKLSKTTIRIEIVGDSLFNFSTEETLKSNKTFGDGLYSPRGSFMTFGVLGKFYPDSLSYIYANTDSIGNVEFAFLGHKIN